ncbi:MAG: hypothetical protein ACRENE_14185 [Polyangiaceae bacterium]
MLFTKRLVRSCVSPEAFARGAHRPLGVGGLAVLAALATESPAHATGNYPACNLPSNPLCAMTDTGNRNVMTGGETLEFPPGEGPFIAVHMIFYGSWTDAYHQALSTAAYHLVPLMSDSYYGAITETYSGPSGTASGRFFESLIVDLGGTHFGTTMNNSAALNEISYLHGNGDFPLDTKAIYLIFIGNGVTYQGYAGNGGTGSCGYNSSGTISGTTVHFAVIGGTQSSTSGCEWGFLTPHNLNGADPYGQLDYALSIMAHEINEIVTDPGDGNGGWWSSTSGATNTQMADFCNNQVPQFQASVSTPGGPAYATFHAGHEDFYLQPLRANAASDGSVGYCVSGYGGVFWNQNFGYSWLPTSTDWAQGSYKGECESEQPLVGLSLNVTQQGVAINPAHAIMCSPDEQPTAYAQSAACFATSVSTSTPGTTTCPSNDFVAGFAQTPQGAISALLCCPLGLSEHQSSCYSAPFDGNNVQYSTTPYDWDWFYAKAECLSGDFVAGVVTSNSNGAVTPADLKCCTPTL